MVEPGIYPPPPENMNMSRPQSEGMEDTPRSSLTMIDRPRIDGPPRSALDEEVLRDEIALEKYGGGGVHDSQPRALDGALPAPPPPAADAEPVTWDGPDDPANPQNWSRGYKWAVTWICIVMTINV